MTTPQVNFLNIGLMLVAVAVAFRLPFELFLFAYAVLGPLHYLTEISWLHDRKYFVGGTLDAIVIALPIALITFSSPLFVGQFAIPRLAAWNGALVFLAFALSLIFVTTHQTRARVAGGIAALAIAPFLVGSRIGDIGFAVFLPTLVHVFVFTGLFIWVGSLRSQSRSGYASLLVFLGCAMACLFVPTSPMPAIGASLQEMYTLVMGQVNIRLVGLLGLTSPEVGAQATSPIYPFATLDALFRHESCRRAARLIAFAYTYHYFNWFSKTKLIGWHDISRGRLVSILVVWAASVGLYAYDYLVGLAWLFSLSLAHVFLEFPLNWRSIGEIRTSLRKKRATPAR